MIEKRRQGFGKVTIIYVKSFIQEECENRKEKPKDGEVYKPNFSRGRKRQKKFYISKLQEVPKTNFKKSRKINFKQFYISNSNNTNINNTNLSENKSNPIVSADG